MSAISCDACLAPQGPRVALNHGRRHGSALLRAPGQAALPVAAELTADSAICVSSASVFDSCARVS